MTSYLPERPELDSLQNRVADPAPVPESFRQQQKKGWFRWIGELLGICHRYTAADLDRVKRAGVRIVEANADLKSATAKSKLAEAEKLFAEAEAVRLRAAIERAIVERELCEAQTDRLRAIAEAVERVETAISRIRQNGGDVVFDSVQLKRLLNGQSVQSVEFDNQANVDKSW